MSNSLATLVFGVALAGPASAAESERKYAVLLIDADYTLGDAYDLQKNPDGFWNLEEELQNMKRVLHKANDQNIPVFDIEFVPPALFPRRAGEKPQCYYFSAPHDAVAPYLRRYGGGLQHIQPCATNPLLAALRTEDWVRLYKKHGDSFEETALHAQLQQFGITDLILMGQGEFDCVRTTAETALGFGYRIHTSFDVMQQMRGPDERQIGIRSLQTFYQTRTALASSYADLPLFQETQ